MMNECNTPIAELPSALKASLSYVQRLNAKSRGTDQPLLVRALQRGQHGRALLLLCFGHIPDAVSADGWSTLHYAVRSGFPHVSRLLRHAQAQAIVNLRAPTGAAAIHLAVQFNRPQILRQLLEHGADVNMKDGKDRTPLHLAAADEHEDIVAILLEHGASIEAVDHLGFSPLLVAVNWRKHAMVEMLLERGASVQGNPLSGTTPLHEAVDKCDKRLVEVLLKHGAELHHLNAQGLPPLHITALYSAKWCRQANIEHVVQLLLRYGADRSLRDKEGRTAQEVAEFRGLDELAVFLHTCYPLTIQMEQLLLGMRDSAPTDSAVRRLGSHETFDVNVLGIVDSFISGKDSGAFAQLQCDSTAE